MIIDITIKDSTHEWTDRHDTSKLGILRSFIDPFMKLTMEQWATRYIKLWNEWAKKDDDSNWVLVKVVEG